MRKKILIITIFLVFMLTFMGFSNRTSLRECYIRNIYVEIEPKYGTKVVTRFGMIEDVKLILSPTSLQYGKYEVQLKRKSNNFYKIESTDYWIETQSCFEYTTWDPVILIIGGTYGKGKIIF